jgi:hypothetical protein
MSPPNHSLHTNRRPAPPFRMSRMIGRWIRCQSPVPAAVGELTRSPRLCARLVRRSGLHCAR